MLCTCYLCKKRQGDGFGSYLRESTPAQRRWYKRVERRMSRRSIRFYIEEDTPNHTWNEIDYLSPADYCCDWCLLPAVRFQGLYQTCEEHALG